MDADFLSSFKQEYSSSGVVGDRAFIGFDRPLIKAYLFLKVYAAGMLTPKTKTVSI